jgi:hypothetical protein
MAVDLVADTPVEGDLVVATSEEEVAFTPVVSVVADMS